MNLSTPIRTLVPIMTMGAVLAACSQGPSEAELAQACIAGSHPQLVSEAMCKCFARATLTSSPPQVSHAMLLEMQGKKLEAAAALGDLSFEQRAEIAMQQLETLAKCVGEE